METSIPNEASINDYTQDQPQPPKQPSSKPLIAGIILILAGLLGLLTWASALALDISMIENVLPPESPITAEQLQSFLSTCAIIGAVLSIFTLASGIVAMRRKAWGFAIIGGILGLFTIGPMLLGSILSLVGLILVAISRSDFQ
jgi:hypothetical protein